MLVGIHQRHCHANTVTREPTPTHLAGHAVTVHLTPPFGEPMRITGVYAPTGSAAEHQPLFTHLQTLLTPEATPGDDATHIVLGDWNATDRELRTLWANTSLENLDTAHPHAPTFFGDQGMDAQPSPSRLDNALIRLPKGKHLHQCQATCTLLAHNGDSDHTPLMASWQAREVGYVPPPRPATTPEPSIKFITPMEKTQLEQFEEEVAHALAPVLAESEQLLTRWDQTGQLQPLVDTADDLLEADNSLEEVAITLGAQEKLMATHTLCRQPSPSLNK